MKRILACTMLFCAMQSARSLAGETVPIATPTPAPATQATAEPDRAGFLYTYLERTSLYRDTMFSIDAYKPFGSRTSAIRPFVDLFANDDTRTGGGVVPQTLNDNYAGLALGVQYTNPQGLRAFAQGGVTTKIGSIAATPSGGDLRGGLEYYREWGGALKRQAAYGNFFGDGIYYSRYHDLQFYEQLEIGSTPPNERHPVSVFARAVLALDTHPYFYGNYAELTLGVRLTPFGLRGPAIELGGVTGTYLRGNLLPIGVAKTYVDFRPTISYGVNI